MTLEAAKRNVLLLWSLMVTAATYLMWQHYWPWFTNRDTVQGVVGILLGLFICSRPAANGIDLLFTERGGFRRMMRDWATVGWWTLNGFVMLVGWLVISVGASHLMFPEVVLPTH